MRKIHPTLLVLCATLLWAGVARAEHNPTLVCQESKLRAQAEVKSCLLRHRTNSIMRGQCRNRFTDELKRIDEVAAREGTSCRYIDNGDGTVSDLNTGLMWEKTVGTLYGANTGAINDVNNAYSWYEVSQFLAGLNGVFSSPTATTITGCFANHCDWRLPTIAELSGIIDKNAPGCRSWGACIDPIFGPIGATRSRLGSQRYYWSSTTYINNAAYAWYVDFGMGFIYGGKKANQIFVRAVRGGL